MGRAQVAATVLIATSVFVGSVRADDGERTVVNVANGYVYVSLGTRDGAHEGDRVEFLEDGIAVGVLSFDLCGEFICRAPLGTGLSGKVTRGMSVRLAAKHPVESPDTTPTAPPSKESKYESKKEEASPSGPDVLPYREPIPAGYELRRRRYSTAVTLGWVGFGVSYGLTLLAGLDSDYSPSAALLIPIVGPLIYLGSTPDNYTTPEPTPYVLSTLVQIGSVLCLVGGYAGEKRLVRKGATAATFSVTPVVTRDTAYFGVIGRF